MLLSRPVPAFMRPLTNDAVLNVKTDRLKLRIRSGSPSALNTVRGSQTPQNSSYEFAAGRAKLDQHLRGGADEVACTVLILNNSMTT